jgi:hypothetical protein
LNEGSSERGRGAPPENSASCATRAARAEAASSVLSALDSSRDTLPMTAPPVRADTCGVV